MAYEETMIDAPITPAPVFAYRAIRGIFFGSPDDSPIATETRVQDDKASKANPSPTKYLSITGAQLVTTPSHKRKRDSNNILSPTKSCLRTPGAVTPRRAMLRDLNVTFRVNSDGENKENLQPKPITSSSIFKKPVSPVKTTRAIVPLPAAQSLGDVMSSATATVASKFDAEAYMATTDKEMKKLIRYSQKMREYARKQDEENIKLRGLIEELRSENARLRMIHDNDGKRRNTAQDKVHVPSRAEHDIFRSERKALAAPANRTQSLRGSSSQTTRNSGLVDGRTDATSVRFEDKQRAALDDLLNLDNDEDRTSKVRSKDRNNQVSVPDAKHMNLKQLTYGCEQPAKPHNARSSATTQSSAPRESVNQSKLKSASKIQSQHILTSSSNPLNRISITTHSMPQSKISIQTSTHLPSDRLMAARARVKKKAELRKTSTESARLAHGDRDVDMDVETRAVSSSRVSGENSIVDWAGL